MKITTRHRKHLILYLKKFYSFFPNEKYTIFKCVSAFKARCFKNNRDAWAAVVGRTGEGKSYFVLMMGILYGRPFDLNKNVAYIPRGNEIAEKFDKLEKQFFQIDEAAKEMRAVNWQSKAQQAINVKAMTDRFKNNFVLMIMPNFQEFTKSMRIGSLLFRFAVLYRTKFYARVVLHMKSKNFRATDPWCDSLANKYYEKFERKKQEMTREARLTLERSLPNYVMDFIIPNLEVILPDVTEEYKRLKIESRREDDKMDKKEKARNSLDETRKEYSSIIGKLINALYKNTLGAGKIRITKKAIAEEAQMTLGSVDTFLRHRETNIDKKRFEEVHLMEP